MTKSADQKTYRPMRRLAQLGAEVISDAGPAEVTLRDISRDGAKITPGYWMAPGTAVTLKVGADELPAIVHWARKDAAGLRFLDRPDPDMLRRIEESDPNGKSA
jgi:hypothetical protein